MTDLNPAAVIFDLDGTIYLGDELIAGAHTAVQRLRDAGMPVFFLSNNPTKTPAEYVHKLAKLGIKVDASHVLTSGLIMAEWLASQTPIPRVYPIGEPALVALLTQHGVPLSDTPGHIDYVLASFDRTFAYAKLQIAFDAIRAGATLIATNPDKYCPVPGGGQPDAAALIAAICACTDTTLAFTAGKPSQLAAHAVARRAGVPVAQCMMVGDRLETDMSMGDAGMRAAVVMSGATTPALLATWRGYQPDMVCVDVNEVVTQLLAARTA
jgi:HAD superfamily hydrolase (TIGR01450 family)